MADNKYPRVRVQMASGGSFVFELYPHSAPNSCNSIIHLAKTGAYDGQPVNRIVPGFAIQPGYGPPHRPELAYAIDGEFADNGFTGGLPIEVGSVAMAGNGTDRSSGSSFFITMGLHPRLVNRFAVVGKIIEGWDEVKRIEAVETVPVDSGIPGVEVNRPVTPEIMEKITVETFGIEYPPPVKKTEPA